AGIGHLPPISARPEAAGKRPGCRAEGIGKRLLFGRIMAAAVVTICVQRRESQQIGKQKGWHYRGKPPFG
ncbi:hypothetical protein, partial [Aeromonas hydrophila]|uniref:hypothetical protein n=1 Tax=Aeromonas hydrophila TaxID=644 RepID=UPI001F255315